MQIQHHDYCYESAYGTCNFFLLFIVSTNVYALPVPLNEDVSIFRHYKEIPSQAIGTLVSVVVELPLSKDELQSSEFAVYDSSSRQFRPFLFVQSLNPTPLFATNDDGSALPITDGNNGTFASFEVPGDRVITSTIHVHASRAITSSQFNFSLDANVALPFSIKVVASVLGEDRVVVAEQRLSSESVSFPKTTSSDWTITFSHIQPS